VTQQAEKLEKILKNKNYAHAGRPQDVVSHSLFPTRSVTVKKSK
jgi:hypothetical protein